MMISEKAGTFAAFMFGVSVFLCAAETDCAAWWSFDEGTGESFADSSGNSNSGTLFYFDTNTQYRVDGRRGKAIRMNGVDNLLDAGNGASLNITNMITLCAWVQFNALPDQTGDPCIVGKWDVENSKCSWFLGSEYGKLAAGISPSGLKSDAFTVRAVMLITNDDGSVEEDDGIPMDVWMHVAMTCDGRVLSLYTNGLLSAIDTNREYTPIFSDPDTSVYIGRAHGNNTPSMSRSAAVRVTTGTGKNMTTTVVVAPKRTVNSGFRTLDAAIDEVRVYKRVLSGKEIAHIYRSGK